MNPKNKTVKFLIFIGDKSYSIYLIHIILYSDLYYNFVLTKNSLLPHFLTNGSFGLLIQTIALFILAIIGGLVYEKLVVTLYLEYGKIVLGKKKSKYENI